MEISLSLAFPLGSAVSALVVHHFILKRYEIDAFALQLGLHFTAAYLFFFPIPVIGLKLATLTALSFYTVLTISILSYRTFFHPLRNFPGPLPAKLTKWWATKQTWDSNFRYYRNVLPQFRHQYGDYVRTGPREIAIFDPAAIQPILGFNAKTTKGPYYDIMERSLHLNRDRMWHRQRRRVWDGGMKETLSNFTPRIEEHTSELLARIDSAKGELVPLNEFCRHYSYDVMSTLAFGKSTGFNTGHSTKAADNVIQSIEDSMYAMGLFTHVPWFIKALGTLTSNIGPIKLWGDWSKEQLQARRSLKNPRPDFMMHLITATPDTPGGDHLLFGDAKLIVGAGSDTTANSLMLVFIHLALHPEYQHKLLQDFAQTEYSCSRPHPLLDGFINETMRLWPTVYSPSQRVTPPEGIQIPNAPFIPGNTIVCIAASAMNRDERNFVNANEFIPERFTTKPELCIRKEAFIPFLTGPYVCAGKNLAMMELRSVVRRVVEEFEVILPEAFDRRAFFDNVQDYFIVGVPKVEVRFVKRQ
jgi:cytochrome P450